MNTEGSPNGMAIVLKTIGRNPLEVRLLCPPQRFYDKMNS